MVLNMKTRGVLMLLALTTVGAMAAGNPPPLTPSPAASAEPEPPGFADGWRLSGILKQGGKLQASLEHATRTPRFVIEGSELVAGVRVEKIDPTARSVTVRRGNLIAIIRSGSSPVIVKSSPLSAPQASASEAQPQTAAQRPTATAGQDANGHWGIQLSDGRFFSAEDYAARYGGVDQAMARLNSRLAGDLPPDRKAFAQQMLAALQNAQSSQPQTSSGSAPVPSAGSPVYSAGGAVPMASPAAVTPAATVAPAEMEPVEAETMPAELGNLQAPVRVYRPGPQFSR